MEGVIFDIQRFALNDGPGIRTTFFLKGCPLQCRWCHNPESQDLEPRLRFYPGRCENCMNCVAACIPGAHLDVKGKHRVDFSRCARNFDCLEVCPTHALEKTGEWYRVDQLMAIAAKDRSYYEKSGGGITLSGGEPMLQFEFALALMKAARDADFHTCLDTSGHAPEEQYMEILPYVSLFLFDYKESDGLHHYRQTGVDNDLIMENLVMLNQEGADIILRCPIIPGVNDRSGHFRGIARIARELSSIREVHLLPYHAMGVEKAQQHGIEPLQEAYRSATEEEKVSWGEALKHYKVKNFTIF